MWSFSSLLLLPLVLLPQSGSGQPNKDLSTGGVNLKVLGQSGKISLSYNDTSFSNSQTIEFDSVYERNAQGQIIGNTGSTKHSVNSFASQDFTFSSVATTTYQGLACDNLNFTTTMINNQATLKVLLYIFKQAGSITTSNENLTVKEGSLKFSVVVENWPFCTTGGSGK